MNIRKSVKKAAFWIFTAAFVAGSAGVGAAQNGKGTGIAPEPERGIIYTSPAFGPAIHGYQSIKGVEREARGARIVYVDQAQGPAIFSYPGIGGRTESAYGLHFVDTAYGQAIFSYPGLNDSHGEVKILPLIAE